MKASSRRSKKLRQILLFIFFIFSGSCIYAQKVISTDVIQKVDIAFGEDQKWRNLLREIDNNGIDTLDREYVSMQITIADSINYILISKLFDEYGYLGKDKIGEVSRKFWLLVQHADKHPQFQDSVLTLMKPELEKGNVSLHDYAYLTDRVKVNLGELQIYGTQMRLNSSETSFEPEPVIDPEKLDMRRAEMGLPPIETYILIMNERYPRLLKSVSK